MKGRGGWPQLMIFPEGSTSNRRALMTFAPGAFNPGKTVQPVVIRSVIQHHEIRAQVGLAIF